MMQPPHLVFPKKSLQSFEDFLGVDWGMAFVDFLRCQLEREVEAERQEPLEKILRLDSGRIDQLQKLALKLGASTIKVHPGYGDATEAELIHNIHVALQTKAMIAAVQTSSNYVIVTVILAVIALLSAVVAAFKPT